MKTDLNKNIVFTIDIEPDYNLYIKNGYLGVQQIIPKLLELFKQYEIKGEFYATSDIIIKYTQLMKTIHRDHILGSHGHHHEDLCYKSIKIIPKSETLNPPLGSLNLYVKRSYSEQFSIIKKSLQTFQDKLNYTPISFRAPFFSINNDSLKALENLRFKYDSSILPDLNSKFWHLFTSHNFKGACETPYRPSTQNICKPGDQKIIEFPLTKNILFKDTPLGVTFLNTYGVEKTVKLIKKISELPYVTFLMHPYELLNLKSCYPGYRNIPDNCIENMTGIEELIKCLIKNNYNFTTLKHVYDSMNTL